jgi:hypothetical protein
MPMDKIYPFWSFFGNFVFSARGIFIFGFIKSPSPFGKFIQGGVGVAAERGSRLKVKLLGDNLP